MTSRQQDTSKGPLATAGLGVMVTMAAFVAFIVAGIAAAGLFPATGSEPARTHPRSEPMTTTIHPKTNTASRANGSATPSRLPDAIPAHGDDWAQNLARLMAWPLLAMGFMAVVAGLGTGIAGGVNFGDAFSPGAASAWPPGLRLTGLALILASVVLTLVRIQRSIRFQGHRVTELARAV